MFTFPFADAREREKLAEHVSRSLCESTRQAEMFTLPFADAREREKLAVKEQLRETFTTAETKNHRRKK